MRHATYPTPETGVEGDAKEKMSHIHSPGVVVYSLFNGTYRSYARFLRSRSIPVTLFTADDTLRYIHSLMETSLRHMYLHYILQFLLFGLVFASEIAFDKIPECAKQPCFPFHSSAIGCTSFTKACFCKALAPLNCAAKSCTGDDWYALEDWYSAQCPGEPPLVSMDPGIPLEARKCVREWIVPDKCNASITRNCFCRLEDVAEAISDCAVNTTATHEYAATELGEKFYRDTCIYSEDASGEQRPDTGPSEEEEVVASPKKSDNEPSWEKIGGIVGGIAGFIGIIGAIGYFYRGLCCGKRRREHFFREKLGWGDPPPYTP